MNFIFQMYRQRFQSTTFHVTSTIYRQQAIKLEKLKQWTECNSAAFSPAPPTNMYFYHFQMVLPSLRKHKGGEFTRKDAKNKKSGLSSNF